METVSNIFTELAKWQEGLTAEEKTLSVTDLDRRIADIRLKIPLYREEQQARGISPDLLVESIRTITAHITDLAALKLELGGSHEAGGHASVQSKHLREGESFLPSLPRTQPRFEIQSYEDFMRVIQDDEISKVCQSNIIKALEESSFQDTFHHIILPLLSTHALSLSSTAERLFGRFLNKHRKELDAAVSDCTPTHVAALIRNCSNKKILNDIVGPYLLSAAFQSPATLSEVIRSCQKEGLSSRDADRFLKDFLTSYIEGKADLLNPAKKEELIRLVPQLLAIIDLIQNDDTRSAVVNSLIPHSFTANERTECFTKAVQSICDHNLHHLEFLQIFRNKMFVNVCQEIPDGPSPIQEAIKKDRKDVVSCLLRDGKPPVNVNGTDSSGRTFLMIAVQEGTPDMIHHLTHELHVDPNREDEWGRFPLHAAIKRGNHAKVRALLENGANVNAPNRDGLPPLAMALNGNSISSTIVQHLVEFHAQVNMLVPPEGFTPVMKILKVLESLHNQKEKLQHRTASDVQERGAIQKQIRHIDIDISRLEELAKNLTHREPAIERADINQPNGDGDSPLSYFVAHNDYAMSRFIALELDADVNYTNPKTGKSPLIQACTLHHASKIPLIRMLVEERHAVIDQEVVWAALNSHDNDLFTLLIDTWHAPVSRLKANKEKDTLLTSLLRDESFESDEARLRLVQTIVRTHRELINRPNQKGETALSMALKQHCTDVALFLIENGADPTLADEAGDTALTIGAQNGNIEFFKKLHDHHISLDQHSGRGPSPLTQAIASGQLPLVQYLIQELHVDPFYEDGEGMTALIASIAFDKKEVVQFLLQELMHGRYEKGAWLRPTIAGLTPLRAAILLDQCGVADRLLKEGASAIRPDANGELPLTLAKSPEMIQLLRDSGADFGDSLNQTMIRKLANIWGLHGQIRMSEKRSGFEYLFSIEGMKSSEVRPLLIRYIREFAEQQQIEPASTPDLQALMAKVLQSIEGDESSLDILQRIQAHKPVLLEKSFSIPGHAIGIVLQDDTLTICNRGAGKAAHAISTYRINPALLTEAQLDTLLNMTEMRLFPKFLQSIGIDVEHPIDTLDQKDQRVGNCPWANGESAVYALFNLLLMDTILDAVQRHARALELYKRFSSFGREKSLVEYLKSLDDTRCLPNSDVIQLVLEKIDKRTAFDVATKEALHKHVGAVLPFISAPASVGGSAASAQ